MTHRASCAALSCAPATRPSARSLALLLGLSLALTATAPSAAHAQIAVVGNTVDEQSGAPGQHYQGSIVVRNFSREPQSLRIYQTDYRFFADGSSRFDSAGSTPRSNAKWITPSARSIVLAPLSDVTVTYSVAIPAVDSLRGTYWSALMLEGAPTAAPVVGARQVGLSSVIRYAVQLATQLPTSGSRRVRLSKSTFALDSTGAHALDVVVENAGERAYRPSLWVELYDASGAMRARLEKQRGLLYPGSSLKQRFAFPSLPAGSYKAVVFADTGDETVSAAQYKLTF